ncbi:MAG: hypothetical protein RL226_321 [Bacteroidota bacterium]
MRLFRLFILLALAAFTSCHSSYDQNEMAVSAGYSADVSVERAVAPEEASVPRKLIREAWMEFETENTEDRRTTILAAVEKHGGYVASEQAYNQANRQTLVVVVRVPENQFDVFLQASTSGVEDFDRREVTVDDVTEEFLDVEARLTTKKELELRYLDLLKEATTVTEILEIERELGTLRADIEAIEGRLKYLQSQVSLSTVTFSFYAQLPDSNGLGKKFSKGWGDGWDNLLTFLVGLIQIWPFLLIAIFAFWLFRRARAKRRQ